MELGNRSTQSFSKWHKNDFWVIKPFVIIYIKGSGSVPESSVERFKLTPDIINDFKIISN